MIRITKLMLIIATVLVVGVTVPAIVFAKGKNPEVPSSMVTICHKPDTKHQETMTLTEKKLKPHFKHGDRLGQCVVSLPDTAKGVPIDPNKGYFVEEIKDGLYWMTEGTYQVMFLTHADGVIVVDAPPSIGQNILNAIAEVAADPTITHVIYSHSHADHISGAFIYPPDATYIAHVDTASQLARNRPVPFGTFVGGKPVPPPTVTFTDNFTLEVGGQKLELEYRGNNHDQGNIYIYAPEQKVLMLVDVIFPGWTPFKELAVTEDIPGFIQAHEEVLSFVFDTFIGGHLNRLGSRDDVETQQEYILDIQANAIQALQAVDFFEIAQQTGFENQWLLFDTYLDAVEKECTELTVPEWIDRLGAVDVFTSSHCAKVIESLRID